MAGLRPGAIELQGANHADKFVLLYREEVAPLRRQPL
jgi:hypothetical protein